MLDLNSKEVHPSKKKIAQKLLSLTRKCVEEYDMIQPGDRIAVGLSGGKDSLTLLWSLAGLRRFYPVPYTLEAITVDMGMDMPLEPLRAFCGELDVPYTVVPTQIKEIVFDVRQESNPCSLCANLRRGCLNSTAVKLGCNKAALGHHMDDAAETFLMSLFYESRISCFRPVTELDRTGITVIRPMLYMEEALVRRAAEALEFPVVKNKCPADGTTKRQDTKELIAELRKRFPELREGVIGAMQRLPLAGWEKTPRTER